MGINVVLWYGWVDCWQDKLHLYFSTNILDQIVIKWIVLILNANLVICVQTKLLTNAHLWPQLILENIMFASQ